VLFKDVTKVFFFLEGLITGAVIKRFSYRKVAIVGGILFSTGIFFASMATTMTHLLFSYSLLSGEFFQTFILHK
jgi:hypothetical protein